MPNPSKTVHQQDLYTMHEFQMGKTLNQIRAKSVMKQKKPTKQKSGQVSRAKSPTFINIQDNDQKEQKNAIDIPYSFRSKTPSSRKSLILEQSIINLYEKFKQKQQETNDPSLNLIESQTQRAQTSRSTRPLKKELKLWSNQFYSKKDLRPQTQEGSTKSEEKKQIFICNTNYNLAKQIHSRLPSELAGELSTKVSIQRPATTRSSMKFQTQQKFTNLDLDLYKDVYVPPQKQ